MNVLIINAGSTEITPKSGKFNTALTKTSKSYFYCNQHKVVVSNIDMGFNPNIEVDKILKADLIIYHTPIWWFSVPYTFKKYIDTVFTAGAGKLFKNDGRSEKEPKMHYGTGGLLTAKYMLTTSWNSPIEAFTTPGEILEGTTPDTGVMKGFHTMNKFIGLKQIPGFHFYDVIKNLDFEEAIESYKAHLEIQFEKVMA